MEFLVISENKLKIMLSSEDMKKYGLKYDNIDYSFPQARIALKNILSDVQIETGFDTEKENDRIFIQLYPSVEGGCEMFVTKMGLLCPKIIEEESLLMPAYKEQSVIQFKPTKKPAMIKKTTLTYCFDKLEWVCCACRELKRRDFSGESALYRDKEGRYYLLVSPTLTEEQKNAPSSFLSEFGSLENTEYARLYVNENGRCICQSNAVEIMSEL